MGREWGGGFRMGNTCIPVADSFRYLAKPVQYCKVKKKKKEAFEFLFTFCHKGGVICMSEVIDISPGNLDSSLCFFQPSVSHDVLCIS